MIYRYITRGCSEKLWVSLMASGKHVRIMYTPLHPTLHMLKLDLQGYTYFCYLCPKTLIVGTR